MKVIVAVIAVLLSCATGTFGQTTLTAAASADCVSGSTNIPVTGTVTLTCTATTATVAAVQGDGGAAIEFQKGGTTVFSLAKGETGTTMSSADTTNFPVANLAATASGLALTVVITSFPSGQIATDWSCLISNDASGTNAVTAETSAGNLNLATFCSLVSYLTGTCSGTTVTLTCDPTTTTVALVQAEGAAAIQFSKGATLMFQLAAAESGTTMSTSDTTNFPVANLAASIVSNNLQVVVTNFPTAQRATDWSCAVSGGGGVTSEPSAANLDIVALCGAEMNKIAGLLVALMVAMKTLLF